MRIKSVLFDLDGTLIDTAPDMAAALNHILYEEGMEPLLLESIRPHVSRGGLALTRLAFNDSHQKDEIEPLRLRFLDYYRQNIATHSRLFEGFETVFQIFSERSIPWGIVTNKPGWLTDPLISELSLDQRSAVTISGDTTEQRKPHPLPLITAAAALDLSCEDCMYVGDDPRDIMAGNAANMTTVIARYGYITDDSDLESWNADSMVESPEQILDLL